MPRVRSRLHHRRRRREATAIGLPTRWVGACEAGRLALFAHGGVLEELGLAKPLRLYKTTEQIQVNTRPNSG